MLADDGENLLAQHVQEVGPPAHGPLMGKHDLQPLPRDRSGFLRLEKAQDAHATLRPNKPERKLLRSVGTTMSTSSPRSRRAASRYALAGALAGFASVTGVPRLEARSTSVLSGMMPSSGIDRISRTSSTFSISPRPARTAS